MIINSNLMRYMGIALAAFVIFSLLTGCAKMTEPYKDAERGGTNDDPADLITMPDGFSNLATKCDNGNRVYTAYHGDSAYASITVVANDPTCKD